MEAGQLPQPYDKLVLRFLLSRCEMKEKNTAKRLFSVLWIYFLCAALTAILIPLPQKESAT